MRSIADLSGSTACTAKSPLSLVSAPYILSTATARRTGLFWRGQSHRRCCCLGSAVVFTVKVILVAPHPFLFLFPILPYLSLPRVFEEHRAWAAGRAPLCAHPAEAVAEKKCIIYMILTKSIIFC